MKYAHDFEPTPILIEHYKRMGTTPVPGVQIQPRAGRLLDLWRGDDLLGPPYVRAVNVHGKAVMVRREDLHEAVLVEADEGQLPSLIFPTLYSYKHLNQVVRLEATDQYVPDVAESRGYPRYGARQTRAWLSSADGIRAGEVVTLTGYATGALTPETVAIEIDQVPIGDVSVRPDPRGTWGVGTWSIQWEFFAPGQVLIGVDGAVEMIEVG